MARSTHQILDDIARHIKAHVDDCAVGRPDCCTDALDPVVTVGGPHPESGRLSVWLVSQRPMSAVHIWEVGVHWKSDGYPNIGDAAHPGHIPNDRLTSVVPYFHSVHAAVLHGIATLDHSTYRQTTLGRAVPFTPDGGFAGWQYSFTTTPR